MMRKRAERDDELRLLALIARGLGADLDDYETPAERLSDLGEPEPARDPAIRRLEVIQIAESIGGDVA
jgi:hypothetical protein